MNLWLSPQGIWYYRKVTVLPVVVVKRSKNPCIPAQADGLCDFSYLRAWPKSGVELVAPPETSRLQSVATPMTQAVKPLAPRLSALSDSYLKEKSSLGCRLQARCHMNHPFVHSREVKFVNKIYFSPIEGLIY